jgi:hypothetical protein
MTRRQLLVVAGTAAVTLVARRAAAEVNIGISINAPAPPPRLVVSAPPALVVVPGSSVYYVPSAGFNLFVFGGRYYSFHNDAWFVASAHNGPWAAVAVDRVPKPVLGVPVTYYRIPPGHAKRLSEHGGGEHGGNPGRGKGPKHR